MVCTGASCSPEEVVQWQRASLQRANNRDWRKLSRRKQKWARIENQRSCWFNPFLCREETVRMVATNHWGKSWQSWSRSCLPKGPQQSFSVGLHPRMKREFTQCPYLIPLNIHRCPRGSTMLLSPWCVSKCRESKRRQKCLATARYHCRLWWPRLTSPEQSHWSIPAQSQH